MGCHVSTFGHLQQTRASNTLDVPVAVLLRSLPLSEKITSVSQVTQANAASNPALQSKIQVTQAAAQIMCYMKTILSGMAKDVELAHAVHTTTLRGFANNCFKPQLMTLKYVL